VFCKGCEEELEGLQTARDAAVRESMQLRRGLESAAFRLKV
jgi:hypothetical protein